MNFNLHFVELHNDNSINDKNNLFENHIPKCDKVKRILISFNCFSEYTYNNLYRIIKHVLSYDLLDMKCKITVNFLFNCNCKNLIDLCFASANMTLAVQ